MSGCCFRDKRRFALEDARQAALRFGYATGSCNLVMLRRFRQVVLNPAPPPLVLESDHKNAVSAARGAASLDNLNKAMKI